jgi:hypothetical protein
MRDGDCTFVVLRCGIDGIGLDGLWHEMG